MPPFIIHTDGPIVTVKRRAVEKCELDHPLSVDVWRKDNSGEPK